VRAKTSLRDPGKVGKEQTFHDKTSEELLIGSLQQVGHRRGALLQPVGPRFQAGLQGNTYDTLLVLLQSVSQICAC